MRFLSHNGSYGTQPYQHFLDTLCDSSVQAVNASELQGRKKCFKVKDNDFYFIQMLLGMKKNVNGCLERFKRLPDRTTDQTTNRLTKQPAI